MEHRPTLLFIDATVRPAAQSRTYQLCQAYLEAFAAAHPTYEIRRRVLREENLTPATADYISRRDCLITAGDFSHPMFAAAQEFASADEIVIGAPYWDLSFPAIFKLYLEQVCVNKITFAYGAHGVIPLCRAARMTYLTTCGGKPLPGQSMGADYVQELSRAMFGIARFETESAELLDVVGSDVDSIMQSACARVRALAATN